MNALQRDPQRLLKSFKLCPACRAPLHERAVADVYAAGRLCDNGHHYVLVVDEPAPRRAGGASGWPSPWRREADCWLTMEYVLADRETRRTLNPQLAEMVSRLLAIEMKGDHIASEADILYCPLDGEELVELEQPDVWVHGLRCARGHEWWERGHRVWTKLGERRVTLKAEMSDGRLRFLIRNWLGRSKEYVEEQLGPGIVRVLERFLEAE